MDFLSVVVGDHPLLRTILSQLPAPVPTSAAIRARVLYVKGSNRVLGSWWGSAEHRAFRRWLVSRAMAGVFYHTVAWDGDPIDPSSFTHTLTTDVPELLPEARLLAARIESHDNHEFRRDLRRIGATIDLLPDALVDGPDAAAEASRPPHVSDAQWRYVRLGALSMDQHGPGDVVVLGGGDVPLNELRHAATHARHAHDWYCFWVDGRSSICDAYEHEHREEGRMEGAAVAAKAAGARPLLLSAHYYVERLSFSFSGDCPISEVTESAGAATSHHNRCGGELTGYEFRPRQRRPAPAVATPIGGRVARPWSNDHNRRSGADGDDDSDSNSESYEPVDYNDFFTPAGVSRFVPAAPASGSASVGVGDEDDDHYEEQDDDDTAAAAGAAAAARAIEVEADGRRERSRLRSGMVAAVAEAAAAATGAAAAAAATAHRRRGERSTTDSPAAESYSEFDYASSSDSTDSNDCTE
jgi:hypothetical protein